MNKILIIDDEPFVIRSLQRLLEVNNYEIISAGNGQDGIEKAIQEKPDLILLDVLMPKMSGHEVLVKLKENEVTRPIPVVMLTARGGNKEMVKSIGKEGAADYITKPYTKETLLITVMKVLVEKQVE